MFRDSAYSRVPASYAAWASRIARGNPNRAQAAFLAWHDEREAGWRNFGFGGR
jgi:hypothetical protein